MEYHWKDKRMYFCGFPNIIIIIIIIKKHL